MDYYSILGLKRNATQDDIKKAYRKLAMKNHPDRGGDSDQFAKISEAYEILSDPQKRSQYDHPQPQFDSSAFTGGFSGFEDLFAQTFRSARGPRNRDIKIGHEITFQELYVGKNATITYRLGNGSIETLDIQIPPGVKDGSLIRFQGYGDNRIQNVPRGDLILQIRVRNTTDWQIDNANLIKILRLNTLDLILGTTIEILTPDNKKIDLKIPKGLHPGTTLSMNGLGLPIVNTNTRGNIYVKVNAETPNITDEEILEKLRKIKNDVD